MLLLAAGADIHKEGNTLNKKSGKLYAGTPLMIASNEGHFDMVQLLLNEGADVNKANYYGATPLFVAADGGHLHVVALLLTAGADKDKRTISGISPLSAAIANGHADVVRFVVK